MKARAFLLHSVEISKGVASGPEHAVKLWRDNYVTRLQSTQQSALSSSLDYFGLLDGPPLSQWRAHAEFVP
jgi:hypothetical protein